MSLASVLLSRAEPACEDTRDDLDPAQRLPADAARSVPPLADFLLAPPTPPMLGRDSSAGAALLLDSSSASEPELEDLGDCIAEGFLKDAARLLPGLERSRCAPALSAPRKLLALRLSTPGINRSVAAVFSSALDTLPALRLRTADAERGSAGCSPLPNTLRGRPDDIDRCNAMPSPPCMLLPVLLAPDAERSSAASLARATLPAWLLRAPEGKRAIDGPLSPDMLTSLLLCSSRSEPGACMLSAPSVVPASLLRVADNERCVATPPAPDSVPWALLLLAPERERIAATLPAWDACRLPPLCDNARSDA